MGLLKSKNCGIALRKQRLFRDVQAALCFSKDVLPDMCYLSRQKRCHIKRLHRHIFISSRRKGIGKTKNRPRVHTPASTEKCLIGCVTSSPAKVSPRIRRRGGKISSEGVQVSDHLAELQAEEDGQQRKAKDRRIPREDSHRGWSSGVRNIGREHDGCKIDSWLRRVRTTSGSSTRPGVRRRTGDTPQDGGQGLKKSSWLTATVSP